MFDLTRRLEFSAAHRLCSPALSEAQNRELYGPCFNLHGHNYALEVTVRGPVDSDTGMVMDLNVLATLLHERIFTAVDHRNLESDVPWLEGVITTAENVAAAFWDQLAPDLGGLLYRVRLYESRDNFTDYLGPAAA